MTPELAEAPSRLVEGIANGGQRDREAIFGRETDRTASDTVM
jgi:hypothetical protein